MARFILLFLIFAVLLSACSGPAPQVKVEPAGDQPTAQPDTQAADRQPAVTAPAAQPTEVQALDPIEITIATDESTTVEAVIPLEGGQLTLEAKDGARYTLNIPGDALVAPALVRMTAVAQVAGLPFGAPKAYAVQLEPEGLAFSNFVTLTIETPEVIPPDEQIFFGYQQNGKDVFLAPAPIKTNAMQILLMHFSGYGVTKGFLADVAPVRARLGGSDETRIQSEIALLIQRERQRLLLGGSEDSSTLWAEVEPYVQEYYEKVVKQRIAAAGQSCAAGRLAVETAISFVRSLILLGGDEDQYGINLNEVIDQSSLICLQEEYALCAEQHIIHRMIPVWVSFMRQQALFGQDPSENPSALVQEAQALAEKCLTFELEFESSGKMMDVMTGFVGAASAKVPLRFDASTFEIRGTGPLVPVKDDVLMDGCTVTHSANEGTFEVFRLVYDMDLQEPGMEKPQPGAVETETLGEVTSLFMHFFPGVTSGPLSVICDGYEFSKGDGSAWWSIYMTLHMHEQGDVTERMNYEVEDWTIHGGALFAERSWERSDPSLEAFEQGSMKLYHRPGQ
jgi:hypothetical protein